MSVFIDGDLLEYSFPTSDGLLDVHADVRIDGSTLELGYPSVYSGDGTRIYPGVRQMLQIARQIQELAKLQGFKSLRIIGHRLTGATPGRSVFLERTIR
jgi:hypothetical protein